MLCFKFSKIIKFMMLFYKVDATLLHDNEQQEMIISSTHTFNEINNCKQKNYSNK